MSLPPEELRRTPPVLTNHDPFSITFLRMDDGRKLHADVSRQTWDEEAPRPPEFHQHAYYEMVFVLEGEMTQHLEHGVFRYQAGDALLLNRNIRHFEGNETDCEILFLCLDPEFLRDTIGGNRVHADVLQSDCDRIAGFLWESDLTNSASVQEYLDFACSLEYRQQPVQNPVYALLDSLRRSLNDRGPGYAYQIQADLLRLLALLNTPEAYHLSRIRVDASDEAFIYTRVLRYLEACHGHATRTELGEALHYNGDYLNRLVKRVCGKTILQLGQEVCVRQASHLLRSTDLPISSIVEQLGMVNRTHFYQIFQQQMGCSPQAYREQE